MTATAAPDLMLMIDEEHQPVIGAAQNRLIGADCWMRSRG